MIYIINSLLFIIFLYLDFNAVNTDLIKWLMIFNNFIYTVIKSHSKLVILATMFTFIADYFLIFTDNKIIGVCCFIVVQYNYMKLLNYSSFIFLIPLTIIFIDPLIILSLSYAILSCSNLLTSFKHRLKNQYQYHFYITIVLLACCDILVALTSISVLTAPIFKTLIWIFYIPSQLFFISSQKFLEK